MISQSVPVRLASRRAWAIPLFGALLLLGACDRQSGDSGQAVREGQESAADAAPPPPPGLSGELDISKRGEAAPDVRFTAPDGSPATLADFRGKPLLVNLWATWCAPCVVEMPTLDALAEREKDRLQVLVVSQDLQGAEIVEPFFAKNDFTLLKPYTDTENGLGFAYATGIMPTTILYDSQGKEVWRMLGGMDWNGSRAAALMADTLAQMDAAKTDGDTTAKGGGR